MLSIQLKHPKHAITNPNLKTVQNLHPPPQSRSVQSHQHPSLDLKNKIISESNRELGEQRWQFLENRRESQLNSMFNRRKTMLESISRKNRTIYQRIVNQQGHYALQKINKEHLRNDSHPQAISLAERSKALLSISRQALANSLSRPLQKTTERPKNHTQYEALIAQKQNLGLGEQSTRNLQPLSKGNATLLYPINGQHEPNIVESRYLQSTRLKDLPCVQSQNFKVRACSVGRKRTCDIYINF